jgi:hypothetical protein
MTDLNRTKKSAVLSAIAIVLSAPPTEGQRKEPDNVRLTLVTHSAWNRPDRWCAFSVETSNGGGDMWRSCGVAGPPPRPLTKTESATVRRLYALAHLFEGGHIGADLTASDVPFFMLTVRSRPGSGPAVALIISGNATFNSGPRRELFDWLRDQETKLLKDAGRQ